MVFAFVSGLIQSGAYLLLALGFALMLRIADIPNMAHGTMVAGGMYLSLVLVNDLHIAYYASIPMAVVLGLVPCLIVYESLLRTARREGHRPQIVYTLLLLSLLQVIYQIAFGVNPKTLSIPAKAWTVLGVAIRREEIVGFFVAIIAAGGLFAIFRSTAIGKSMEIAGKYPEGAQSIGLPIERLYRLAFLTGSALALLAGALILPGNPVTPFVSLDYVVIAAIIAIAARLSFPGCVVVALLYGIGDQVLAKVLNDPGKAQIVLYGLFIIGIAVTQHAQPLVRHAVTSLRLRVRATAAETSS